MKAVQWMAFGLVMLIIVELLIVPDQADAWGRRRRSSRRRRSWLRKAGEGIKRVGSTVVRGISTATTAVRNALDSTVGRGILFGVGLVNGVAGSACCTALLAIPVIGVGCCGLTRGVAGILCATGASNTAKSIERKEAISSTLGAAGTASSCLQAATGIGGVGHIKALIQARGKRSATKSKAECKATLYSDTARLKMHICTLLELRAICKTKTRKIRRSTPMIKAIRASKSLLAVIAHTNRRRSLYKLLAATSCKKVDLLPTCHPSKLEMATVLQAKPPAAENLGYDPLSQPCRYVKPGEGRVNTKTCVFRETYAFTHLVRELGLLTTDVMAAYPTAVKRTKTEA